MKCPLAAFVATLPVLIGSAGCSPERDATQPSWSRYQLSGPLIPARLTMVTAWDFPKNPLTDTSLDDSRLSNEIRLGFRIFTNTPAEASRLTASSMSCNNCHPNGGQREKALPLVAVAGMFPEYNKRAGRLITLADRIVDCFLRSENAAGVIASGRAESDDEPVLSTASKEVLAVSAYLVWLSRGHEVGKNPAWRGQNTIPTDALIPLEKLDPQRGEAIFQERCTTCHAPDGLGKAIGDKQPGALWGPLSWNDGAGAARIYTLAGIIRYAMPYLDPGSLNDADAQHLAAFIDSKPRPAYPYKDRDYRTEKVPIDSVYYSKRP